MLNPKLETDTIELRWKAQKYEYDRTKEEHVRHIVYENKKSAYQDLKDFIIQEGKKGARISLNYFIDGVDLGVWLNLNYFGDKAIEERYSNTISHGLHSSSFENNSFHYHKIILKRILGQLVNAEDCSGYLSSQKSRQNDIISNEEIVGMMSDENENTVLYCSACCGDKLCGYFGISVYHTDSCIVWYLNLGYIKQKIYFKKSDYFEGFKEYINLVNNQLCNLNISEVNIHDDGERLLNINEKVELLIQKHKIDTKTFDKIELQKILETGLIEDINASIYLAETLGFSLEELEKELDDSYNQLSEKDKNGISWKMHDNGALFGSLELYNTNLVWKAFLLFG